MLSRTSRYALRILGFLVEHQGSRIRGEEIAGATGIPANYLSKILNQLRKQGLVDSEKGWGGGFELRKKARSVKIREVLRIFEGVDVSRDKECVFGLAKCDSNNPCPLHSHWVQIQGGMDQMLTSITVKDLGRGKRGQV